MHAWARLFPLQTTAKILCRSEGQRHEGRSSDKNGDRVIGRRKGGSWASGGSPMVELQHSSDEAWLMVTGRGRCHSTTRREHDVKSRTSSFLVRSRTEKRMNDDAEPLSAVRDAEVVEAGSGLGDEGERGRVGLTTGLVRGVAAAVATARRRRLRGVVSAVEARAPSSRALGGAVGARRGEGSVSAPWLRATS